MTAQFRAIAILSIVAILGACGPPRAQRALAPVPVQGSARDLRALAGEWEGEFVAARGARRGIIAFSLSGRRDTAYGRVILRGPTPPPGCTDPVTKATGTRPVGDIVLTVAQLNVGGPSVGGWLRPYPDPELGCLLDTWFEGTLSGDTLDGMYFSHPADTAASVRLGTWWVARKR